MRRAAKFQVWRALLPVGGCILAAVLPLRGPELGIQSRGSDPEPIADSGLLFAWKRTWLLRTETTSCWISAERVRSIQTAMDGMAWDLRLGLTPDDIAGEHAQASIPPDGVPPSYDRRVVLVQAGLPLRWLETSLLTSEAAAGWSAWTYPDGSQVAAPPGAAPPDLTPLVVPGRPRPLQFAASAACWIAASECLLWAGRAVRSVVRASRRRRGLCPICRYPAGAVAGCAECGAGRQPGESA